MEASSTSRSSAAVLDRGLAEISTIVGAEHVRDASAADAVLGVPKFIEPGTPEQVAAVLKAATAAGLAVIPRGGGTKLAWGNPPKRADLVLSLARLNRIEEHAWEDMTATVSAGCTIQQVQDALAKHRQRIALETVWPERATIGGVLSANETGAIRLRFGGLRDLIIGATVALSDGTLARSGGKVVKNVAGYDLPKLVTGAMGTLGVITQAIFRLHPIFPATKTVSFAPASAADASNLILAANDSPLVPTGLQVVCGSEGPVRVDARFEGVPAGIDAQVEQLKKFAGTSKETSSPADCWRREQFWQGAEPALVAKFSIVPAKIAEFCEAVRASSGGMRWRLVAQAYGVGWLRLEGPDAQLLAAATSLRKTAEAAFGSFVVLHCPAGVKQQLDPWGSAGDALNVMARIKTQFDPDGTLNPGRFVGGI